MKSILASKAPALARLGHHYLSPQFGVRSTELIELETLDLS